jgi:hypothetical protein
LDFRFFASTQRGTEQVILSQGEDRRQETEGRSQKSGEKTCFAALLVMFDFCLLIFDFAFL